MNSCRGHYLRCLNFKQRQKSPMPRRSALTRGEGRRQQFGPAMCPIDMLNHYQTTDGGSGHNEYSRRLALWPANGLCFSAVVPIATIWSLPSSDHLEFLVFSSRRTCKGKRHRFCKKLQNSGFLRQRVTTTVERRVAAVLLCLRRRPTAAVLSQVVNRGSSRPRVDISYYFNCEIFWFCASNNL
jgi:hypothetical protein